MHDNCGCQRNHEPQCFDEYDSCVHLLIFIELLLKQVAACIAKHCGRYALLETELECRLQESYHKEAELVFFDLDLCTDEACAQHTRHREKDAKVAGNWQLVCDNSSS